MKVKVIKVIPVALASWRAAFDALKAMTPLVIAAIVLIAAITLGKPVVLRLPFFGGIQQPDVLRITLGLAVAAVGEAVVLAVLMIDIQRFLLVSERPGWWTIADNPRRLLRYAGLLAIPMILWRTGPLWILYDAFTPTENWQWTLMQAVRIAILVLPYALCLIFAVVFAAIAVDADTNALRSALENSRRGLWRVFLVLLCIQVPFIIVTLIMASAAPSLFRVMTDTLQVVTVSIGAVLLVLNAAVYAACCTYIYRCYADVPGRAEAAA